MSGILQLPHFKEFEGLVHGFTTRALGADYDRLAVEIKILGSQIFYLNQIHGGKVAYVGAGTDLSHITPADALVTDCKDIIIGVKTADCVPILLYDDQQETAAAIHAGYKGILNNVIQNTLQIMTERLGCRAQNLCWAIGPSICVEHYQVGLEVIDAFKQKYGSGFIYRTDLGARPHLDLRATAKKILFDSGLDELHGMDINLCTFEREDLFYSHRRQSGEGRQFNFIGMVA